MNRIKLTLLGLILILSSTICSSQTLSQDKAAISFIRNMYNAEQYEDYAFLERHCTKKMLKKLIDNFGYDVDGVNYATWLFRSGAQDEKYNWGQNVKSESKILSIEEKGDHWYAYTALDMGWKFTNWVYLIKSGNTFLIDDVITVLNEWDEENY